MSGPGGEQVGKVTVRVAPDTSRFDDDLKRELRKLKDIEVRVPVEFDVDTAGLRAQIEAIRVPTVRVPVEFDMPNVPPVVPVGADTDPADRDVDEFVRETEARRPEVEVTVDVDRAAFERTLSNLNAQAKIDVDQQHLRDSFRDAIRASHDVGRVVVQAEVDRSAFMRSLDGLRNISSAVFSGIGKLGAAAFNQVASAIEVAETVAKGLSKAFVGVLKPVAGAVLLVTKLGAISAGVAVAGAGITAAWGAASAAIATIPAVIGLLGAPIATVMLGMDGIKRAAQTLKPEFDRLKESVSATFERGLIPVLNQVRSSFVSLTGPINNIADSLVGLAQRTADWITKAGGASVVREMLNNIAVAIDLIDLAPLLDGFTRLAGHKDALNAVVGLVNALGVEFQKIADSPFLTGAFRGLQGVLESLTQAFGDLVRNGLELFAAAAPGVRSFIDDLAGFFNQFDWTALGQSVGNVFRGIGEALKGIPPGTIQAIQDAFRKLGDVFMDPAVQQGIRDWIALIPTLIGWIEKLIRVVSGVPEFVSRFFDSFSGPMGRIEPEVDKATKGIPQVIERNLGPIPGQVGAIAGQIPPNFMGPIAPLPSQVGGVAGQIPSLFIGPIAPLPGMVGGVAGQIPGAMTGPIETVPGQVGAIAGRIPGEFMGPIAPLPGQVEGAGKLIVGGFGSGLQGLSPALQAELGLLPPVATTGIGDIPPAVQAGLAGVGPAVTAGLTPAQLALTTALTGIAAGVPVALLPVQTAFTTGFATIVAAIPTTFTTPMQTALTTAFTTIVASIPTTFTTPLQTALTTGVAAIVGQIPTIFTVPFQTAMATAFTTVLAQIPAIFTLPFQTALTTAFTTIFALFPTLFTLPFQTALTTAFATVFALFPTIFTLPLQTAFTTAFTTLFTLFPTIFTVPFQTALTTAMTTISTLIPTLFAPINTAFTTAFAAIVALVPTQLDTPLSTAATTAMTNFQNAITTGFTNVNNAVTAGLNAIIANLNRLPPAGTTTGNNLITAMANAIIAGRSRLVNAIAQVIAAAIAAATAILQINSPSRVFQKIGLSIPEGAGKGVTDNADLFLDPVRDLMKDGTALGQDFSQGFALPDWSGGSLGGLSQQVAAEVRATSGQQAQPVVNVFVGDEQLDSRTDYRVGLAFSDLRRSLAVR